MKRVRIIDGSKAADFYAAEEVDAELEALERIKQAAINLFQKCGDLCLPDMDKLEAEINALSDALKASKT